MADLTPGTIIGEQRVVNGVTLVWNGLAWELPSPVVVVPPPLGDAPHRVLPPIEQDGLFE